MKWGGDAFTLKKNQYFMMGDNRTQSLDSRYFGPIERKTMVGRAFVRIWPVSRIGGL
jgi:signal peptidase I